MHVEAAETRRFENGLRQDQAIRDHDGRIGSMRAKSLLCLFVLQRFRCVDRKREPPRFALDGRGLKVEAAAARLWRARIDGDDVVSRAASSTSVGTAKSGVPMKIRRIQANLWRAGAATSADMMRRLLILGQRLDAFGLLCRFLEFLHHHVALEFGNMVDEQHAVDMIDLVLQAGCQ